MAACAAKGDGGVLGNFTKEQPPNMLIIHHIAHSVKHYFTFSTSSAAGQSSLLCTSFYLDRGLDLQGY